MSQQQTKKTEERKYEQQGKQGGKVTEKTEEHKYEQQSGKQGGKVTEHKTTETIDKKPFDASKQSNFGSDASKQSNYGSDASKQSNYGSDASKQHQSNLGSNPSSKQQQPAYAADASKQNQQSTQARAGTCQGPNANELPEEPKEKPGVVEQIYDKTKAVVQSDTTR